MRNTPFVSQYTEIKHEGTFKAFGMISLLCVCSPGHEPSALDTVEAFHPQRKKWERLAPMTFPRCSTSSIIIRDRLLVVGGVNQVHLCSIFRMYTDINST